MAVMLALNPEAKAGLCREAIDAAAIAEAVPKAMLQAIAEVEAGFTYAGRRYIWPWSINDHGRTLYFRTREDALRHAREQIDSGRRNLDLGCFQISWRWHAERFEDLGEALDPKANALYAARYLQELLGEFGSWSKAVAAYHSRRPKRAAAYQCRIAAALQPGQPIDGCPGK